MPLATPSRSASAPAPPVPVAVPSAVAKSTLLVPAVGPVRVTVKVAVCWPWSPSASWTSPIASVGWTTSWTVTVAVSLSAPPSSSVTVTVTVKVPVAA